MKSDYNTKNYEELQGVLRISLESSGGRRIKERRWRREESEEREGFLRISLKSSGGRRIKE